MFRLPDEQVAGIRWDWLNKQIQIRRHEYSTPHDIHVCIITWNVNGCAPNFDAAALRSDPEPELIVIGLQEVVSANQTGMSLLWGDEGQASVLASGWIECIADALSERYRLLDQVRLAGMLLVVFVGQHVRGVESLGKGQATCGLMGVLGNKGGVALKVQVHDSTICFVNSHLAAHLEYVGRRNQDYKEIRSRLLIPNQPPNLAAHTVASEKALHLLRSLWSSGVSIDACDFTFWLGDLNYRLNSTRQQVMSQIADFDALLERDQLREEVAAKRAFHDFAEPAIRFPPSYKFDPNTSEYDTSEKARCPAYCDRILYRQNESIACLHYDLLAQLTSSDHRPVAGLFKVQCCRIDDARFGQVFADVLHSLDLWENAQIPVTELLFPGPADGVVDFGEIRFRRMVTRSVTLKNTGSTPAHFGFVPSGQGAASMEPWIRTKPASGTLLPGCSVDIALHVLVGPKEAYPLNMDRDCISGKVFVLHILGGRDHFIAIEGAFRKTLFARPLQLEYEQRGDLAVVAQVPVPLRRLSEHILKHDGLRCESLLLQSGERCLVDHIIDCIDEGVDFPEECRFEAGMLAVGECLLRWLESLPDPVLPVEFSKEFILHDASQQSMDSILRALPDPNWIVFDYIMGLFRTLPTVNVSVDPDAMCVVLGEALCRYSMWRTDRHSDHKLGMFIKRLL